MTVHRTATTDFSGNKDDESDTEPSTLELTRLVRVLHSVATPRGLNSYFFEGPCFYFPWARGIIKVNRVRPELNHGHDATTSAVGRILSLVVRFDIPVNFVLLFEGLVLRR